MGQVDCISLENSLINNTVSVTGQVAVLENQCLLIPLELHLNGGDITNVVGVSCFFIWRFQDEREKWNFVVAVVEIWILSWYYVQSVGRNVLPKKS